MPQNQRYPFTRRWTNKAVGNWNRFLVPLADRPLVYLEIGVYEARSASWIMRHVLTHPDSRYIGIDPWDWRLMARRYFSRRKGGPQLMAAVEALAHEVLEPFGEKAKLIKGLSADVLPTLDKHSIDAAYIDGSHLESDVLVDTHLTWPLVKVGGIVMWDDYHNRISEGVCVAVDPFLERMAGRYELLFRGCQCGVRKLGELV